MAMLAIVLFNRRTNLYHKATLDTDTSQLLTNEQCNLDDSMSIDELTQLPMDTPSRKLCKRCYGAVAP